MNRDRIFENSLNIIRDYLKEEVPTNSLGAGKISGTPEAGDGPPVDLRRKRYKKLPEPFKDLFRRTNRGRLKYPR
jgi:hypothetical protein